MVFVVEGNEFVMIGVGVLVDMNDWGVEWGVEWDDNDEEMDVDNSVNKVVVLNEDMVLGVEEDDGVDVWGWGDEDDMVLNDVKLEE